MNRKAVRETNYSEHRATLAMGVLVLTVRRALLRCIWGAQWEGRTG